MDTTSYKTLSANKKTADKKWVLVDAQGQHLGRMASKVAKVLRGKYKVNFTPHVDCGDNVVIINAEKVHLTGKKWDQKEYDHYTGYPGGHRSESARDVFDKNPATIVERAVKRMLPKNRLGRQLFRNLYVYTGEEHGKDAQKPKKLDLSKLK